MKTQRLTGLATVVLVTVLIGTAGCRRKRVSPSPGVERSSDAPTDVPIPSTATGTHGSSAIPASHPGEAQNPAAIKLARDQFERKMQRPPNDWHEMIDAKLIPAIPKRKDGQPLDFSEYTEFYIHRGGKAGQP